MSKSGFYLIVFLVLLLIAASCKENSKTKAEQLKTDQTALTKFEKYLINADYTRASYDSLIYPTFLKTKPGLENIDQLTLYRRMGEFFFSNELPDSALKYFVDGLKIAKEVKNTYYTSVFCMMKGSVYTFISDFEPALTELKTAYNLSMATDSLKLQIRASRNLGNVYWNLGNYDLALEYYLTSLNISQKAENKLGIASALNNIGNVYQEIKNYDRAIEYYKQSAEIAEKENFARVLAISNNNLGDVFSIKNKYDSALYYFNKALAELKKVDSKFDAGIYIGNIADIYLKTDSLEKSKKFFIESLSNAELTGDKTGMASGNLGLADLYLHKREIDSAYSYLEKGTRISEDIGSLKLMENAYKLNAAYFAQKNNYESAFHFVTKQMSVKDSTYSLENGQNVARLENQYKEVKSIKEIELLKEKQKGFLYLAILGFVAIISISLVILFAYRQKTRSNKILSEKNMEIEASSHILEEKHQQLVKSQEQLSKVNKGKDDFLTVISHDLKNPLSSIRGFTELLVKNYHTLSDEERITFLKEVFNSIERISLLINNILFWVKSQTDGINIKPVKFNLSKRIIDNVSIYHLMLTNKEITLNVNIPEDLYVMADINVFDMIVRNILSNALKFTNAKGNINISCEVLENKAKLSIGDSGIGIPADKLKLILAGNEQFSTAGTNHEQGTGLGLGLTYKFIQQTGGDFEIESEPGKGTKISFFLDKVS